MSACDCDHPSLQISGAFPLNLVLLSLERSIPDALHHLRYLKLETKRIHSIKQKYSRHSFALPDTNCTEI